MKRRLLPTSEMVKAAARVLHDKWCFSTLGVCETAAREMLHEALCVASLRCRPAKAKRAKQV